jgi:2-dehydro-3-deoxygalactonokinase
MVMSPDEFHAHALRAADAEHRLPLSRMTYWDIAPFEQDGLRVVPLRPPVVPEPPRQDDDPASCGTCAARDEGVWLDEDWRLRVVPGVTMRDAHGIPDVMRGEETQIVGAVNSPDERVLMVLPGTHSKWACAEGGRLVAFTTFMTGEIWRALLNHTILGRLSVPTAAAGVGPGFREGIARGLGQGAFLHEVFGARTLTLAGELDGGEVSDWLSGFVIGRELRCGRTWANHHGFDGARVRLIGGEALVARYAAAFAQADVVVDRAPDHAAARGLWHIALRAGLIAHPRAPVP